MRPRSSQPARRWTARRGPAWTSAAALSILALVSGALGLAPSTPAPALGAHTANPTAVGIPGSYQSEAGCSGDWQPDCAATKLTYDATDDVWQGAWTVPAGSWEYKAALNDSWSENYGAGGVPNGPNIGLSLASSTSVKFYYDHESHWITDNVNSVIAVAPGSFQSELGCSGDWQPDCLRSWLQDPDGDGIYGFETTALPAGSYEGKAAIDESWSENYGQGGVPNGANIPFTVPWNNAPVTFTYDAASHLLTILAGHAQDGNVEWNGLRHDSRSDLYRTPGGAVPAGTPVTIRFRTFHDDVSAVKLRLYSLEVSAQQVIPMTLAAADVSCYEPALASERCDFWSATRANASPDNLWYRFIVSDGVDTDNYADDTWALDGGAGATSDEVIDRSWALTVHEPSFTAPDWAREAVVYQIFPDRFRNGRSNNDPDTGDVRYDDPVLALPWGTLPEGYCRNYADGATNCPWRFDSTPPDWSPTKEAPRGRDYMGGDLKGVTAKLDYLQELGVTAIYFNPIFAARSNHRYDTANYRQVDPDLGTLKEFKTLVQQAEARGIRVILDGVFNHLSSDSPFFDRYHHYPEVGACESAASPWRGWFFFQDVTPGTGSCAGSDGTANAATYTGWFGFDSIPVLDKSNPGVVRYFVTAPNSISRTWLSRGAAGWRLDVSGDPSFPDGYWESFRAVVKAADPEALTISETWQKDSTLLRMLRGDRLDTTMNYRLRDAVVGLLAVGAFDSKGFADSGHVIGPSQFAARIAAIREDYPDAAYYSLMNLLDSHDTERLLWTLTPGSETTADKELNAANLAEGKARVRIASLIQFTMPGAPTVYYGDEVGMTGDDDPDDRRTYPWADLGGSPDTAMLAHYQGLADLRAELPVLTDGDLRMLLADDPAGTLAYGRRITSQAAIVAVNRSPSPRTLAIPVAGYLPDGVAFDVVFGANAPAGSSATVAGGMLTIGLPALSGVVLATGAVDLDPPAPPANLHVTAEGDGQVALAWAAAPGAASYDVYSSPLPGGGYVKANLSPVGGTSFTVTGLENARRSYFVVRALDAIGNASGPSNEVDGIPHLAIGWANLQWPPSMTHTISTTDRTDNAYGQVWIGGGTSLPGPAPSLRGQLGFGPDGSNPAANPDWTWVEASFNVDAGNNDEFMARLLPDAVGEFDYVYRYSTTDGRDWLYADLNGPIAEGASPSDPGDLTVLSSGDTTAPATPSGLTVESASPEGIELSWDAVVGDPTLHGYEIGRATSSGGPYAVVGAVSGSTSFTDTAVVEGATYWYVVRAVDTSFNRSAWSAEVEALAELRTVTLTFNVTVPAWTPASADVYIAGTLSRLDGGYPDWSPGAVVMAQLDATHWTITFTGRETTQLEYKYTLGSWDFVEKGASCDELANRQLVLSYGSTGTQVVNDTVLNWRNVSPCGN